jgi:hypothetical protein
MLTNRKTEEETGPFFLDKGTKVRGMIPAIPLVSHSDRIGCYAEQEEEESGTVYLEHGNDGSRNDSCNTLASHSDRIGCYADQ